VVVVLVMIEEHDVEVPGSCDRRRKRKKNGGEEGGLIKDSRQVRKITTACAAY
jgi:hypothetical protein